MSEKIGKVKCRVCENEFNSFCKVKKTKVKSNKARHCEAFIMDSNKIKVSVKPKSVMRPDWYWNRKEYIKLLKEDFLKQQASMERAPKPGYMKPTTSLDEKPDVLSRYRSTATNDEEPKTDS